MITMSIRMVKCHSLAEVLKVKNNIICVKYFFIKKLGVIPLIWDLEGSDQNLFDLS